MNLEHKSPRKSWDVFWAPLQNRYYYDDDYYYSSLHFLPEFLLCVTREAIFDFQFFTNELWQWHWSYRQIEFADELLHDWKNHPCCWRKLPRFSHLDICFSFVLEFFTKLVFHVEMHKFFYAFLQLHIFKIFTKILFLRNIWNPLYECNYFALMITWKFCILHWGSFNFLYSLILRIKGYDDGSYNASFWCL